MAQGTILAGVAANADDQALLSLLFVPGFTTRDSADPAFLPAGASASILALEAGRAPAGRHHPPRQPTEEWGSRRRSTSPSSQASSRSCGSRPSGETFALPIQQARRILLGRDPEAAGAVPLLACVRGSSRERLAPETPAKQAAFAVELEPLRAEAADWGAAFKPRSSAPRADQATLEDRPATIGVDRIGTIEEVTLRALLHSICNGRPDTPGAVVRGAELRLCLDAHALADAAAGWASAAEPPG